MLLQILSSLKLDIKDYVIIILTNGAVTFLVSEWMKLKIKEQFDKKIEDYKATLKSELDKKLEDYKFAIKTKEQATKIAELFSKVYSTSPQSINKDELNKLVWELSLWLPEEILIDLSQQLADHATGKDVKEILMDIRKLLLNTPQKKLKAEDIPHFQ